MSKDYHDEIMSYFDEILRKEPESIKHQPSAFVIKMKASVWPMVKEYAELYKQRNSFLFYFYGLSKQRKVMARMMQLENKLRGVVISLDTAC